MSEQEERWRQFAPDYYVSDKGRVKSIKGKGTILKKIQPKNGGFFRVSYCVDRNVLASRIDELVIGVFVGLCPPMHKLEHIDGDRHNDNLNNLRYAFNESSRHNPKQRKGKRRRGQKDFLWRIGDILWHKKRKAACEVLRVANDEKLETKKANIKYLVQFIEGGRVIVIWSYANALLPSTERVEREYKESCNALFGRPNENEKQRRLSLSTCVVSETMLHILRKQRSCQDGKEEEV